jgi:glycosyltransferase involved in cell wall biosynthesis
MLPSCNLCGGTPKKILNLIKGISVDNNCYLYLWSSEFLENKILYEEAGATIYEGFYKRNIFQHLRVLLKIIDTHKIDIIQTQFTFGETLGWLIKLLRPKTKLIISFVSPFCPRYLKYFICSIFYKRTDAILYISNYVRNKKLLQFKVLNHKYGCIIYNGAEISEINIDASLQLKKPCFLAVSGLIDWKNINVLVEAINTVVHKYKVDVYLYIAGDGPERQRLTEKIGEYKLEEHVFILGYRNDIPSLLRKCDVFVHPSVAEGFGIAVAEAMLAQKPIIVANAGALPELIENKVSGLVVDPYNVDEWVHAMISMLNSADAKKYASDAQQQANQRFSVDKYVSEHKDLYALVLEVISKPIYPS